MSYRGFKRWKSDTYTHTYTHTHSHTPTSGRQQKITFLDVLDYSEYSDTISKKIFFTKTASSARKQNVTLIWLVYLAPTSLSTSFVNNKTLSTHPKWISHLISSSIFAFTGRHSSKWKIMDRFSILLNPWGHQAWKWNHWKAWCLIDLLLFLYRPRNSHVQLTHCREISQGITREYSHLIRYRFHPLFRYALIPLLSTRNGRLISVSSLLLSFSPPRRSPRMKYYINRNLVWRIVV